MRVVGIIALCLVAAFLAPRFATTSSNLHTVTYRVTGGQGALVTFKTPTGDTAQDTAAITPWTHTEQLTSGAFYYVSAQNQGSGTITCSVEIDGTQVTTNPSSGPYAICTASGSV